MNIQKFKNNELKRIVCEILGKSESDEVYEEETEKIERLNINPRIFKTPTIYVDLGDLYMFKNLKSLYIRDLCITDYQVQCINQLISLEYLQMNKCKLDDLNILFSLQKLEVLALISSYGIDVKYLQNLQNLKVLKIINSSVLNYKGLKNLNSLEEIYLQNLEKVNLVDLLKMNNLKFLNLDGSSVKKERHEIILKDRIKVDHAIEYLIV